jgi:cellulose synthase/poly-beta-1,6-N-acetylglucosamine synthase-like glycosyltransferase
VYGFTKVTIISENSLTPKTRFSIVVPFRNEAENLPKLLHSLSLLNYPKELFEVILVDDDSEEVFSVPSIMFSLKVIQNERKTNSPKKDAINTAITVAKNDWIITTDADCIVQNNWLLSYDNYIQKKKVKMVAAGVSYLPKKGFLHDFQNLDFLSLQGVTIGSFGLQLAFMCNGANFAYQKLFFHELNGFERNDTVASGDDVFLLQKAIRFDKKLVGFLKNKESIIATQSVGSWQELFNQRVRWASKSTGYSSNFGKFLALLVLSTNLIWIINFILWLTSLLDENYFILFIAVKFVVDLVVLLQARRYFDVKVQRVLLSSVLYPFFSVAVAFYSLLGNYEWKGRRFRK